MGHQSLDYLSPPPPPPPQVRPRIHPLVWLVFIDAAIGVAMVVVVMLAYENVPIDREPPPLTVAMIEGLFILFLGLTAAVTVGWLLVLWRRRPSCRRPSWWRQGVAPK